MTTCEVLKWKTQGSAKPFAPGGAIHLETAPFGVPSIWKPHRLGCHLFGNGTRVVHSKTAIILE